ncbi:ROK family protein [Streptomyces lateritius]|uniref:ROK family protein n=1 Tax=Streptomyces lateritius TaxID=67313 RepID=UPI0037DA5BD8
MDRTGRYLGAATANLVNLLNPRVLVLGNQVVDLLGERLLSATYEAVTRHALPLPHRAASLRRSAVPHNAVTRGAAAFALEGYLDDREVFGPGSRMRQLRERRDGERTGFAATGLRRTAQAATHPARGPDRPPRGPAANRPGSHGPPRNPGRVRRRGA